MTREAYFDNAKLILIFFVIFGHLIQPYIAEINGVQPMYMWNYTFSMPAFIFTAGFFAKGAGNMTYIIKLAKKMLLPYLCFQIIYHLYYIFIGKSVWGINLFKPEWSLWFLMSLFSWHIMLIFYRKLPPVYGISLAVLIGVLVGYIDDIGQYFSLSRTFVFFPFFLIGYWLTMDKFMLVKHKIVKTAALFVLVLVGVVIYFLPDFSAGWLLASKPYTELGLPQLGGLARLLVYFTSTIMAISILAWVPTKRYTFTYLGERTLYVYLLHGFFIQFFRETNVLDVNNLFDIFGLALLSILILFLLSHHWVLRFWKPVVEGKMPFNLR